MKKFILVIINTVFIYVTFFHLKGVINSIFYGKMVYVVVSIYKFWLRFLNFLEKIKTWQIHLFSFLSYHCKHNQAPVS